ncbi:MAG: hypothetical protein WBB28_10695 [Crinalium sp.]
MKKILISIAAIGLCSSPVLAQSTPQPSGSWTLAEQTSGSNFYVDSEMLAYPNALSGWINFNSAQGNQIGHIDVDCAAQTIKLQNVTDFDSEWRVVKKTSTPKIIQSSLPSSIRQLCSMTTEYSGYNVGGLINIRQHEAQQAQQAQQEARQEQRQARQEYYDAQQLERERINAEIVKAHLDALSRARQTNTEAILGAFEAGIRSTNR